MTITSDPVSTFFEIALKNPELTAVVRRGLSVSYKELRQLTVTIATYLKKNRHTKVAILLPNGHEAFASMFGAILAGGQYCPLNTSAPKFKIDNIIASYQPDIVITNRELKEQFQLQADNTLVSDIPADSVTSLNFPTPPKNNIAYTIFTSGSTGVPKGVEIPLAALSNYLMWIQEDLPIELGTHWSQLPNIGFDLSVLDIYGALCHGATLFVNDSEFDKLFPAKFIKKHQIEILNCVPSILELIYKSRQLNSDLLSSIKLINVCGEPLKKTTLDKLFNALPDVTIQNTYGPTEATVSCTAIKLSRQNYESHCENSACFGRMIPGVGYFIDTSDTQDEGELVLFGKQIAKGYLNNSELTGQKFFKQLINGQIQDCYRTGDIVYIKDHNLYFKYRKDDVCKIKGRLVDLNELEALISHKTEKNCHICINGTKLCLFIEKTVHSEEIEIIGLRSMLGEFLEPHELPDSITFITQAPRNQNDKIDKKALLELLKTNR